MSHPLTRRQALTGAALALADSIARACDSAGASPVSDGPPFVAPTDDPANATDIVAVSAISPTDRAHSSHVPPVYTIQPHDKLRPIPDSVYREVIRLAELRVPRISGFPGNLFGSQMKSWVISRVLGRWAMGIDAGRPLADLVDDEYTGRPTKWLQLIPAFAGDEPPPSALLGRFVFTRDRYGDVWRYEWGGRFEQAGNGYWYFHPADPVARTRLS